MMELEDAVNQARHTIGFLHGCLTNPHVDGVSGGYSYAYPEQTQSRIEKLDELVPPRPWCAHSSRRRGLEQNCESCQQHWDRVEKKAALQAEICAILPK